MNATTTEPTAIHRTLFKQGIRDFKLGIDVCKYTEPIYIESWQHGYDYAQECEKVKPVNGFKPGQWAYSEIHQMDVLVLNILDDGSYIIAFDTSINSGTVTWPSDASSLSLAHNHDAYACDVPPYFHYPYPVDAHKHIR